MAITGSTCSFQRGPPSGGQPGSARPPLLIDPSLIDWDRLPDEVLAKLGKRIDTLRASRGEARPDDLLTPVKVARLVHIHHSVVYEALAVGALVGIKREKRNGTPCWQITRSDAIAWWHKAGRA
jgi:hypothetical protein